MKLIICDVEGTIFQPHMIKDARHASYIWTVIAEFLGKEAEQQEIDTQKKWYNGVYGPRNSGQAYIKWVNESIEIHDKHGLKENDFFELIEKAPYVDGVVEFFRRLNRDRYIPVIISGGIQNLNEKACRDLGIRLDDSYAACKYYFNEKGNIDKGLTFCNTSNFCGKQELVQIALRKYGLSDNDWIFIGDGINDISVAQRAPVSIGIKPVPELEAVVQHSFENFLDLMADTKLMEHLGLLLPSGEIIEIRERAMGQVTPEFITNLAKQNVKRQIGNLKIPVWEIEAIRRVENIVRDSSDTYKHKFSGITRLLEEGEMSYLLITNSCGKDSIVTALLQPFSNAAEIMIHICLALTEDQNHIKLLLDNNYSLNKKKDHISNIDLKEVTKEYLKQRNLAAHTYRVVSKDAAESFIRRTYEIIQRLELIINP